MGTSRKAIHYGIENLEEAKLFLEHPILGKRLIEITKSVLEIKNKLAIRIFGTIDYLKLKSCMTLFNLVEPTDSVFQTVIDTYYDGFYDELTQRRLENPVTVL